MLIESIEFEIEQNKTPSKAFIAAAVSLILYFLALFSVYQRNEEYEIQRKSSNPGNKVKNHQEGKASMNKGIKYNLPASRCNIDQVEHNKRDAVSSNKMEISEII